MKPQRPPASVGDICWEQSYPEQMLSPIAQMGTDETDWFLATHSPITSNDDVGPVEQQDLLENLLSAPRRETLIVLKGDPGTGKSQLINWLKLGFDAAIARGVRSSISDRTLRSVLIRRRSGSLKDALQQLVDQLPGYERHLADIQAAIAGVSGDEANRRLYTEMHHALRATRSTAPRRLQELDQVFIDNGAVSWLCRPKGAIDLNVKRLTEQSEATDRESLPPFTTEDFGFPPRARLGFDEDLRLRLEDDEAVRDQAALRANEHLRQAIAGLTGLRGHTLNEIFRAIREEMQRRGEALALFVEDVSTLSVLDEELVNALQPLNDRTLCPLLSVLGMTEPAYGRLPDNLKGRIDRVLTLSAESSLREHGIRGEGADLFVARYLNGLRSGPTQVGVLAADVRSGELQHSACEECSLRSKCFAAFGSVRLGDTEVGLYPLSRGAATRLLAGLNVDTSLKTPRTLLQYVVLPLLNGMATEFRGATVGLPIHPRSPRDLNAQQDRMLVGWTAEQRGRMSYLLYYWTGHEALVEGATALAPILPWFRHPAFSSVPVGSHQTLQPPVPAVIPPATQTPSPEADRRYREAIARLETWYQQERRLEGDSDYRRLLAAVVNKSLALDDVRVPSSRTRRISTPIDASNIVIEGMIRKPAVASKARFEFTRSQAVFEFLKDLVAFEHLGQRSWRFDGGQEARRRYANWLKGHSDELIRAFDVIKCDREAALRAGVRFLQMAYRFSVRKELPSDRAAAVEAIVSFNVGAVGTMSEAGRALVSDLPQRLPTIRNLVLEELAVRQGERGGINYIDPRPLVEYLSVGGDDLSLGEIDIPTTMADYPEIGRLASSPWGRLSGVLKDESDALRGRVESLETLVRQWRVVGDSVPELLREDLEGARAVIKACEGANESLGDAALQAEIGNLAPAVVGRHVSIIEQAVAVLDQGPLGILTLDVAEVEKTANFVTRCDRVIVRLRDSLAQRLSDVVTAEDVEAERQGCLSALKELTAVGGDGVETTGGAS